MFFIPVTENCKLTQNQIKDGTIVGSGMTIYNFNLGTDVLKTITYSFDGIEVDPV